MNIKDAIYPTIKKKFDELILYDNGFGRMFFFTKSNKNDRLLYDRLTNTVTIDIKHFMLNYFGFDDDSSKNVFDSIFFELLKERLSDRFFDLREDIRFEYVDI